MSTPGTDVPKRYYRRVIRITGDDSPNVRLAKAQIAAGMEPTGEIIIPGVLPWQDYAKRRAIWDKIRQCVSLDAQFWEGAESLLFPPHWLNYAEAVHRSMYMTRDGKATGRASVSRVAKAIGCDPAEGGDETSWSAVDDFGLIEQVNQHTPDTNVVVAMTIAFARKYNCPPDRIMFDRGGGGKWCADRMRAMGWPGVSTVAFGAAVSIEPRRGISRLAERKDVAEDRYAYKNRRAQMYGELSELLDPATYGVDPLAPFGMSVIDDSKPLAGFCIPAEYMELRRQLAPLPRLFDGEGRVWLPPKKRPQGNTSLAQSLEEMIGCSPDRADSLAIAVHCMLHGLRRLTAGAVTENVSPGVSDSPSTIVDGSADERVYEWQG